MISDLNQLVEHIETHLTEQIDVAAFAASVGSTEYHLRRMFSSLVGMSVTEYVRRRRMTLAASDVLAGRGLLDVATAHGYGSAEAFGRAFRSVHGVTPVQARRGGALSTQQRLRFRLTVEGNIPMHTHIATRPAFSLIGHSARVPLIHHGVNPHIAALISALPMTEHDRLRQLSDVDPRGILQISADVDPDYAEGSDLTYMHGVAVSADEPVPTDLDVIPVPAGEWAVLRASGAYPDVVQNTYAASATDWFPANPWRLRPGPSIVAVRERTDDFRTATIELWLPVEHE